MEKKDIDWGGKKKESEKESEKRTRIEGCSQKGVLTFYPGFCLSSVVRTILIEQIYF